MRRGIILIILILLTANIVTAQVQTLAYGEPVTAEVTAETTRFRYTFEGAANEVIYVSAFTENEAIDLQVQVFGPNGTSLGSVTNNALGTMLGPVELGGAGRYTIEISQPDYNLGNTGTFDVLVDRAVLTPVKPDGRYTGTISTPGAVVFFAYSGPANELFGYAATGQNIGFFMFTPTGERFIDSFDFERIENPLNVLPVSGEYVAFLQTSNVGGTEYSLTLKPINVMELTTDQPAAGQLSPENIQVFRFSSPVDQLWRIDVTGTDMQYNTRMELRRADDINNTIASDTGSGVGGAPRIDPFVTPASGDYFIILRADRGTYDYTISLQPSPVIRLESGVVNQGTFSPESGLVTYIYFGIAEEKIRITFETTGTTGEPGINVYSPNTELISFYARSRGKYVFDVTLPETGLYGFVIRDAGFSGANLDFALTLENIQ